MNQFCLGASIPLFFALLFYLLRRGRASLGFLALTPLFMAAFAFWAIIPDIPRLTGHLDLYNRLAQDPRMDIFLWHYTIDTIESDSPWFVPLFVVMIATLLGVAWRELALRERS